MSRWRRDTNMQVFIQSQLFNLFELVLELRFGYESIRPVSVGIWLIKPSKTLNVVGAIHLAELRPRRQSQRLTRSAENIKKKQNKTETENRNAKLHKNNNNKMRKRVKRKTKRRLDADAANEIRKELPNASVASIDRFVSPSFLLFHHIFDWLARSARACSFAWLRSVPLYSALRLHNQQRAALNGATNHIKSMSLRKF